MHRICDRKDKREKAKHTCDRVLITHVSNELLKPALTFLGDFPCTLQVHKTLEQRQQGRTQKLRPNVLSGS
jgi:hypothetical protein